MVSTRGLSLKALKKEPFSGSHCGMRYYLVSEEEQLAVYVYPEPWCFEATPEEKKEREAFSFNEEGLQEGIAWLNRQFEAKRGDWEQADKNKMMLDK